MITELEDLQRLQSVTCSSKETPLIELVDRLIATPTRYILKRSNLQQSHFLIWDTETKDYAVFTHAFAVRQAMHPATGNYVPPGHAPPDGLLESQIKTEPGPYAQLSITLDARLDPKLHEQLSIIESWAKADSGFSTTGRGRNPWMSPVSIANNGRYVVNSPLFIGKTVFNSKDDGLVAMYKVHPWVLEGTKAEPLWLPNPNLVRILHLNDDRTLVELADSPNPLLNLGDVVKMTFKFIFTSYGQYWNMSCCPIQIIRLTQLDKSIYGSIPNPEDNGRLNLPQAGEKLADFFSAVTQIPSITTGSKVTTGLDLPTANPVTLLLTAHDPDLSSESDEATSEKISWGSLTPLTENNSEAGDPDDHSSTAESFVKKLTIALETSIKDEATTPNEGGKPRHSGGIDIAANEMQVTAGRGKKRSSSGVVSSKKTRTVKARTAL
ncbi:hypothetical protein DFP72DRAFT_900525 [Ephemerocybe angulata]|uniref:Uncharacterized protein n=1 Tax=Ephemerocybe angulata TaxID=980116 RepID=A0A8H6HWG8_9AGAR|nr:hypothetical protein DFP72DRAFT_900525 [Tulosesus angulatus]